MVLNLDASETEGTWDPDDPSASSNFSTAMNIYDTLGQFPSGPALLRENRRPDLEWHAMITDRMWKEELPENSRSNGTGTD